MSEIQQNPMYLEPIGRKNKNPYLIDLQTPNIISIPFRLTLVPPVIPWFTYDVFAESLMLDNDTPANIRNKIIRIIFKIIITTFLSIFMVSKYLTFSSEENSILPLSLMSIFFLIFIRLLWEHPSLTKLNLHIIDNGIKPPQTPPLSFHNSKVDDLHIATRFLHPKFKPIAFNQEFTKEQPSDPSKKSKPIQQYNEDLYLGLFIHICRISLKHSLTDSSKALLRSTKAVVLLNKTSLLIYILLIACTLSTTLPDKSQNPLNFEGGFLNVKFQASFTEANPSKTTIGAIGIAWMFFAIFTFQYKINKYHNWLERSRVQNLSYFLPLFVWNNLTKQWIEQTENDLNAPFIGGYGMETEKIINIMGAIALTSFLTWVSLI